MATRRKNDDGSVLENETVTSPARPRTSTAAPKKAATNAPKRVPATPTTAVATRVEPVMLPEAESLTFTVSLPVPVHEVPADELAVSIDEVAATPDLTDIIAPPTTTITLSAEDVAVMPEIAPEDLPVIPALPEPDDVYNRRQRSEIAAGPETAGMLTAERLVATRRRRKPAPEGVLQSLLYYSTFRLVNVGDSYGARRRKALEARIAKQFEGGTRFVPVLTRKGGVGKTTVTTLLGMALADVREDRVIAIDANPDRGTLAERISRSTRATVRDVVTRAKTITTFSEFQTLISRDETRLDVLASDTDPSVSEAFNEGDYNVVADMAERFYSIVVTDCGTGIVHSAMSATLKRADSIVVVSGGSVDEARLASETLTWLETNGYPELVANAVVVINTATHGTNLVKLEEIEAHFDSRVRDVVRIPYDPVLATGSVIRYKDLKPFTRESARELAAIVMDGLPETRTA